MPAITHEPSAHLSLTEFLECCKRPIVLPPTEWEVVVVNSVK